MAATDVIFRIGTVGVDRATAQFGAVVAVLYKVGQTLLNIQREADKFSAVWSNLTSEQQKGVAAMDKATKGFIPTLTAMESSARMAAAGMNPTNAQMVALAKVASNVALKLGEGREGAKKRLDELTSSLIKGNDRGLKPYGIQLKKTGDLATDQANALIEVEKAAAGVSVEVSGLDDKWDTLNDTIDTSIGLTYDWFEGTEVGGGIIDRLTSVFDDYNTAIQETNGGILDFIFTSEGMVEFFNFSGNSISNWFYNLIGLMNDQELAAREAAQANETYAKSVMMSRTEKGSGALDVFDKTMAEAKKRQEEKDKKAKEAADLRRKLSEAESPKRGGGGRRKKAMETMEFTEEELYTAPVQDLIDNYGITQRGAANDILEYAQAQNELNQELFVEVNALSEVMAAENERISLLQQKRDIDVDLLTREEKIELWTYEEEHARQMIEYEAQRAAFLHKESTFYEDLMETGKAFGREDQLRKSLMTKSWGLLTGAAGTYMKALWNGSESAGKAVRRMIHDTLEGYSIEYGIKALAELAETIIAAASYRYDAAAQHSAAAAQCFAVSVAAGAGAALMGIGLAGGGRGQARAPGGYGGGGGYSSYGSGAQPAEHETQTVVVHISGDLAAVLNALTVEARRQKKSGTYQGGF